MGGWDLAWFKYVSTRAVSIEEVEIDTGFYHTLMGIRGVIAPFVAIWLMNLTGLRVSFLISFLIILAGFGLIAIYGKNLKTELAC
jgi:hypothetical protein